jgi:DNA repair exonuclease SbcCD ATPase subunit
VKLNNVKIENFLSVKNAAVDFEACGNLVRIIGKNYDTSPMSSNGAGKSLIIESVMFAMFGKTIRKTNDKSLQNYHTKGKCKVVLTVNGDTVISRTKKPPMLSVTVAGENCTKDSIANTQKYLEKTLNVNYNVFLASIMFGQENNINFLTSTPDEKRSIIQNFLSVKDLFENRSTIKTLKAKYLAEKKLNLTLHDDGQEKLNKIKTKLSNLKKVRKSASQILNSDKAKFVFAHTFSEIQEMERQFYEKEMEVERAMSSRDVLRSQIKEATNTISKFKDTECMHCGKVSLSKWNRILELQDDVAELVKQETAACKKVTHLGMESDAMKIPVTSADFEVIEKVKAVDIEVKILTKQHKSEMNRVKVYGNLSIKAQKRYDLMRFWEHAFSEAGLIKYIIRNVLEYFNERCNSYLSTLTKGNFVIKFDDTLTETIYNRDVEAHYHSLSGGEKKRMSLAVLLGLNDLLLLTGKDRSNVVFFDEVAESLDPEAVKGLIEVIHQVSKHKKLFLITHNEYLTSLLEEYSETLTVSKRNNLTTISK